MQENRSFDHYFGALKGVRGFGDPRPVTLPSGKSVWHQADGTGKETLPFHPTADDLGMQFLQGLNHDWAGGHQAYNGGRYDRWIPAKTPTTMAHLTRDDIPFHYALADRFTVCDAYHCSFIGATDPNRYYLWSGHTGNDGTGGGPVLGNEERGYGWTTYPERLEEAGVSWKIYQDIGDGLDGPGGWGWIDDAYRGNYGDNSLLYFDKYRNAQPGNPLYDKARTGTNVAAWRRLLRRHRRRRPGRNTAADLLGRRTGGIHRALQLPLQLRCLVHRAAAGRADVRPRGVEPDRPVHHLRRERRLLRPRRAAPSTDLRRPGPVHGRHFDRGLRGRRLVRPRCLRTRAARPDAGRLALEHRRLRLLRNLRPHLGAAVHGAALRRARAEHLTVAARRLRRPDLRLRLRPHRARPRRPAGHLRLRAPGPRTSPRLPAHPARRRIPAEAGAGQPPRPAAALRPVRRRRRRRGHREDRAHLQPGDGE